MKRACRKCGGLLIMERELDYYGPLNSMKCVNCGWACRDPLPVFGAVAAPRGAGRGAYR